jgi:1-acyl-sn-glycerol-3-phosphate acyltransferase
MNDVTSPGVASGSLPPAGPIWRDSSGSRPFFAARAFSRWVLSTFFDLKIWGVSHVPRTGGVLMASNHQSYLDPVLIGVGLPRPLSYMSKASLFKHAIFAWLIRSLGAYPVRQGGSAAGAIKETIERLQEGRALNIFPEGSRTEDGQLLPFQNGIALVIRKAKVPVVPVAIHGSFEAYPTGTKYPVCGPIRVLYGPPLILHDLKPAEMVATLETKIRGLYEQLRAMDPIAETRRTWAVERLGRELAERNRKRRKRGKEFEKLAPEGR